MNELSFSPLAAADLDAALDYISRDRPAAAISVVAMLRQKCVLLADFPELGVKRDDLVAGLRAFTAGSYAIYYRLLPTGIRIERVLHAAQDVDSLFE